MDEKLWTPALVEERLVEAAQVLKRMPAVKVQGYFSLWPKFVAEAGDVASFDPPRLKRPAPSPDAITRMEATLGWTIGLDPIDARIVWLRAAGERWKAICWKVGLQRSAAHEHWLYALNVIAWRLNGRAVGGRSGRRRVIAVSRMASSCPSRKDHLRTLSARTDPAGSG